MTGVRPTILVNGRAGTPQPRARVEQLHHLVEILGHQADIIITSSEAEMNAHLYRLVQAGAPRVAVAGGDGTVARAVPSLAYTDTALSILPLGTFNNFAAALNIPRDLHAALRLLWEGTVSEVDLGEVNGHLYTEAAGAGLLADFVALTSTDGRKLPLRTLAATSRLFWANRAYPLRLTIDGAPYDDQLSLCLVANSYRVGMAISVAAGARMTDGRLNVVLVEALTRQEWWPYARATWIQMLQTLPKVHVLTAQEVRLEAPAGIYVHCDDRLLLRAPATFRARPKALKVLV
jgi:diacylglycerol kinase (ATP)